MILKTYSIIKDVDGGSVAPGKLHTELLYSKSVNKFAGVTVTEDVIEIEGGSIKDGSLMDTTVKIHDSTIIDKQVRIDAIDAHTGELILEGFAYDGETFSLSDFAQINWNNIKGNISDLTFPMDISTKTNGKYSLIEEKVVPFWNAKEGMVTGYLESGRDLVVAISAATTQEELDAVVLVAAVVREVVSSSTPALVILTVPLLTSVPIS